MISVGRIHGPFLSFFVKRTVKWIFSSTGLLFLLLIWICVYIGLEPGHSRITGNASLSKSLDHLHTKLATVYPEVKPSKGSEALDLKYFRRLYQEVKVKIEHRDKNRDIKSVLEFLLEQTRDLQFKSYVKEMTKQRNMSLTEPLILLPHCDGSNPLLVVLVLSSQGNYHRREAIRLSWGNFLTEVNRYLFSHADRKRYTWRTIFAIGQPSDGITRAALQLENKLWQDLLVLGYPDDYTNLTNKTVESMRWISSQHECRATYLLKTDDDCFVNHIQLLPWLSGLDPKYKYIGKLQKNMLIVRDQRSKHYVPVSLLKGKYYPAYCSGGGYVFKYDILPRLVQNSSLIPRIRNEDAYMGLVFHTLNEHALLDHRFLLFIYDRSVHVTTLNPCKARRAFVIHNVVGKGQIIYHLNNILTKYFSFVCDTWTF